MDRHINILIIEDHEIVSWSLSKMIRASFSSVSVMSATDFYSGLEIVRNGPIDLVILDIGVPGGSSPDMIDKLRGVNPELRILIYTGMSEKENSPKFFAAGVDGFVSKEGTLEDVPRAIKTVLNNKRYISASAYEAIAASFLESSKQPPKNYIRLTEKETIVLKLMLKGKWSKEIAQELGVKITTISTHKTHIFEKFDVNNLIDLFKAVRERMPGFLDEEPM
jgi:two-component system invasion response regulator UvrY